MRPIRAAQASKRVNSGRRKAECDADDRPVPGLEGGASRMPVVLSPRRLLRAVLRGRSEGGAGARHRADQARPPGRRRHPDVRRAGAQRRELSRAADPQGLQGRDLRADRGPGQGQATRRQGDRRARRGPRGHARHADRGQSARGAPAQFSRGARAEPAGAGARLARRLDRRFPRPGPRASRALPPSSPGSIPASCCCPSACWRRRRCVPCGATGRTA